MSPGQYGRREAFEVHKALQEKGPVRVPREFVFMDRAAIGLGGVCLHLDAELNFHRMYNETIDAFEIETVRARQQETFGVGGRAAAGGEGQEAVGSEGGIWVAARRARLTEIADASFLHRAASPRANECVKDALARSSAVSDTDT